MKGPDSEFILELNADGNACWECNAEDLRLPFAVIVRRFGLNVRYRVCSQACAQCLADEREKAGAATSISGPSDTANPIEQRPETEASASVEQS